MVCNSILEFLELGILLFDAMVENNDGVDNQCNDQDEQRIAEKLIRK